MLLYANATHSDVLFTSNNDMAGSSWVDFTTDGGYSKLQKSVSGVNL